MWPLTDITIYYDDNQDFNPDFGIEANYICDMYHNKLNGYKPPKTARICLHLKENKEIAQPWYFGSICSYDIHFDLKKFKTIISKQEKYKFILDLIHKAILEITDIFNWDKEVFITSYNSIIQENFRFIKEYPKKSSRDKKTTGQVTIEKTELKTILKLIINNEDTYEIRLLEIRNLFWFDVAYKLAEKMKWLDKNNFGYKSKTQNKELYYSINEKRLVNNFYFVEGIL